MSKNIDNSEYVDYLNQLYKLYDLNIEQQKRVTKYQLGNIRINNLKVLDSKFSLKVICSYYSKYATDKFKGIYKHELLSLINSSRQLNTLEFYHQLAALPQVKISKSKYTKILNNLNLTMSLTAKEVKVLNLLQFHRNYYYFSSNCSRRILTRLSEKEIVANKINQSYLKLIRTF